MAREVWTERKLTIISHWRAVRHVVFACARVVVFAISWLMLAPTFLYARVQGGLDPSWNVGVQLAIKEGLIFGKDIIFTYGPLGYLAIRLPIGVSKNHLFAFDILLMAVITWVLALALWRIRDFWRLCLALLAVLMLGAYFGDYPSGMTTLLLLVFLCSLLYELHKPSLVALLVAAAVSVVAFYVKVNVGLVAVALMFVFFVYDFVFGHRHSRWFILAFALVYSLTIFWASRALNTDLPKYVLSSLHVIVGHNEAMYLDPLGFARGSERLTMAVILMVAFVWATIGNIWESYRDPKVWFAHLLVSVYLFEIFKHGFSRADEGHIRIFFTFAPAAIGFLSLFMQPNLQLRLGKVFIVALIFSGIVLQPPLSPVHIVDKYERLEQYVQSLREPTDDSVPEYLLRSHVLPADVLSTIGDAGVDIMPEEITTIYANDLTYNPRPTIQSYAAFDAFLDQANASKYLAADGPAFILYAIGEIDARHPFSSESITKLAMMVNYEVIQRSEQYLLFRKRTQPRLVRERLDPLREARLGEAIELQDDGIQLLRTEIDYSLLGRVIAALYQPPPLNVTILFPDGTESTYRAVRGIANGGMLVSPFVDDLELAELFFDLGQGRRVSAIRFESPAPWAYRNVFNFQSKQVTLTDLPPAAARIDPLRPDVAVKASDSNVIFDSWYAIDSSEVEYCRWSEGTSARLFFLFDPLAVQERPEFTIDITAGTFHTQTIQLVLNGTPIGTIDSTVNWDPTSYTFEYDALQLHADVEAPRVNEMEFLIPNAMSPASQDADSRDERVLGLCLWQLEFR